MEATVIFLVGGAIAIFMALLSQQLERIGDKLERISDKLGAVDAVELRDTGGEDEDGSK